MTTRSLRADTPLAGDGEDSSSTGTAAEAPASEVQMTELHLLLPGGECAFEDNDPALTDNPDKTDEEMLRAGGASNVTASVELFALTAPVANDAVGLIDARTRSQRLGELRIHDIIIKCLCKRYSIDAGRARDALHDAVVVALESDKWPTDPTKTGGWLHTIARRAHVNDVRKRVKRGKEGEREELRADFDDLTTVQLPDVCATEYRRLMTYLEANHPKIAKGVEIERRRLAGEPMRRIAADHGIRPVTAYGWSKAAMRWLQAHKSELVSLGVIGFSVMFLLVRFQPGPSGVGDAGEDISPKAPLVALPPPPDAAALREKGLRMCANGEYEDCLRKLNHARRLDPAGEKADPAVTAARQKAESVVQPLRKE